MFSFSFHAMHTAISIMFLTATPTLSDTLNKNSNTVSKKIVIAHLKADRNWNGETVSSDDDRIRVAVLCEFIREVIVGYNKICYYDCAGDGYKKTVPSSANCPSDIDR